MLTYNRRTPSGKPCSFSLLIRLHRTVLLALPALLAGVVDAQNMVPNPSFETFTTAPTTYGQITNATPWGSAYGSCDLFHTSSTAGAVGVPTNYFGTQAAHSGNAYAGIAWSNTNSYHEYMRVALTGALTIGQSYYCEAYVSAGEGPYRYGVNNFGFLLTTTAMTGSAGDPPISATPQVNWTTPISDYTNWTLVSGNFTATSAAQHLTLGSFYSVAASTWVLLGTAGSINSQYWFIDDVVVQPSVILPLHLQDLSLRPASGSRVQINWTSDAPGDARQFALERSTDGGNLWTFVGQWPADKQTSFEVFDTPGVFQTPLLYRVKQVALDGTVTRSEPKSILLQTPSLAASLITAPNPMLPGEESFVTWASNESTTAHVALLNLLGEVEWETTVSCEPGLQQLPLSTQSLAPGTHILRITCGQEVAVQKIVLQQ